MLIERETRDHLPADSNIHCELVGNIKFKGKETEVEVHQLVINDGVHGTTLSHQRERAKRATRFRESMNDLRSAAGALETFTAALPYVDVFSLKQCLPETISAVAPNR